MLWLIQRYSARENELKAHFNAPHKQNIDMILMF